MEMLNEIVEPVLTRAKKFAAPLSGRYLLTGSKRLVTAIQMATITVVCFWQKVSRFIFLLESIDFTNLIIACPLHRRWAGRKENERMLREKHKNSLIILSLLIAIAIAPAFAVAAQDDQVSDNAEGKAAKVIPAPPEKHTDPFNWAIILVSFGGMFLMSSVHWLHSRRSHLETEINTLSSFAVQTNSVEFLINMTDDTEPMMNGIDRIHSEMETELNALKSETERTIKVITEVEFNLLRRLG